MQQRFNDTLHDRCFDASFISSFKPFLASSDRIGAEAARGSPEQTGRYVHRLVDERSAPDDDRDGPRVPRCKY